jgi:transcription initiation factor TFIIE subunit alpha
LTFEDALESFFKCPSCNGILNLKKNDKSKKAFAKQVDKIRKEMQS